MSEDDKTGDTSNGITASPTELPVASSHEVFRVGLKPPIFCKEQPDLYFIQMDSQFAVADITVDETKYHHLVSSLETLY